MLAIATGRQRKLCEDFLKEIFNIVVEELSRGECVRIKGFGTFKLTKVEARKSINVATGEEHEIPEHNKVMFVAAKELATAVNSPFDAFEAVEIADDIPTDEIMGDIPDEIQDEEESDYNIGSEDLNEEDADSNAFSQPSILYGETELEKEIACGGKQVEYAVSREDDGAGEDSDQEIEYGSISEESEIKESEEEEFEEEMSSEAYSEEMPENERLEDAENSDNENEADSMPEKRGVKNFLWGILAGFFICAAICSILYLFLGKDREVDEIKEPVSTTIDDGNKNAIPEASAISADSVTEIQREDSIVKSSDDGEEESVPTRPSDEAVYDTVTTTRYLTTIAKEHYGNFNLWPIIYEENAAILGHPDRIRPGTKVVVPALSKYNVDPRNPDDVKKIKQRGIAIYEKYK